MSWVANVMLSVSGEDNGTVAEFSEWLRTDAPRTYSAQARGCGFLHLMTGKDSGWGGWKYPECHVWAGALNHADIDALLAHVGSWTGRFRPKFAPLDEDSSFSPDV